MRDELQRLIVDERHSKEQLETVRQIVSAHYDDIGALRRQLLATRNSAEYERAFTIDEPLVSVRIATYNSPKLLVERAISSVLAQTYQRFEIVIVGDACTDDTEARVRAVGDPRIRFVDLAVRGPYPEGERNRWLVAGSPAMNFGAELAQGLWIAPLDHDDEFTPDHIETLLKAARARDFELVYGKTLAVFPDKRDSVEVGVFPPRRSHFGFQASIHPTALRFFEYNPKSWMLDEPGDWNLCRRMVDAGVRMGFVDRIVTFYYPSWSEEGTTEPQAGT